MPAPQKPIAAMLPLADLPAGWTVGKSGEKHIETFNADNLFEKIDGRAESFIQYDVKGMAYAYYHPTGDESNEVQVYIFEMGDTPQSPGQVRLGEARGGQDRRPSARKATRRPAARSSTRARTTRRSSRPRTTPSSPPSSLEMAKRIAAKQSPGGAGERDAATSPGRRPRRPPRRSSPCSRPGRAGRPRSTSPTTSSATASCPTSSWPNTRKGK